MSDIVEMLRAAASHPHNQHGPQEWLTEAADELTRLRAENERLRVENIQMQAALGYGILAEDERHIIPSNPYKCGTCDAARAVRAENERLREELDHFASGGNMITHSPSRETDWGPDVGKEVLPPAPKKEVE